MACLSTGSSTPLEYVEMSCRRKSPHASLVDSLPLCSSSVPSTEELFWDWGVYLPDRLLDKGAFVGLSRLPLLDP
jgi:hypothetical protein